MLMMRKSRLRKKAGISIIETIIYLSLSVIIIFCTLTLMLAIIKRTDEENKSSFRINKLYDTLITIERYTNAENAKDISIKDNVIYFTDKITTNKCEINQQGETLRLKIRDTPLYFMHDERYNASVESFKCSIKGKLLYINIKLKTGEMMKKCIHIDH